MSKILCCLNCAECMYDFRATRFRRSYADLNCRWLNGFMVVCCIHRVDSPEITQSSRCMFAPRDVRRLYHLRQGARYFLIAICYKIAFSLIFLSNNYTSYPPHGQRHWVVRLCAVMRTDQASAPSLSDTRLFSPWVLATPTLLT